MISGHLLFWTALCITLVVGCKSTTISEAAPAKRTDYLTIAHRGACGYLPEHTLEAKALAYGMGADYIEQDLVLTKDDQPIVIHDIHLDTVTNVAQVFPDRKRADGRYYAIDFTLSEIKQLTLTERFNIKSGEAVFKDRFPVKNKIGFKIPSLVEELELIQGLNKASGKEIGIYPELKAPWFHKEEGKDIAKIVLNILNQYGYKNKKSKCFVQCFDPQCVRYMKETLKTQLNLVQLIAANDWNETPGVDYNQMLTAEGMAKIAQYADGIGPWMEFILKDNGKGKKPTSTGLIELAHEKNLVVHPYTFRADSLPSYVNNIEELFQLFLYDMDADGIFTDFPDRAAAFLNK